MRRSLKVAIATSRALVEFLCKAGHVLESFNVGGRKFTTIPAFERWVAKLNEGKVVPGYLSRQREREIRAAERALDEIMGPGWRKRR